MKVRLETYGKRTYDDPPSIATLRRWARNGEIPGAEKKGKSWWVDLNHTAELDPLVAKVLNS